MNYFFKIITLYEFEVMTCLLGTLGCVIFILAPKVNKGQNKITGVLQKQEQTTTIP